MDPKPKKPRAPTKTKAKAPVAEAPPTTTLYEAISEQPELKASLTPEVRQAVKDFDTARSELSEAIQANKGRRPGHKPVDTQPAYQDTTIRNVRQAVKHINGVGRKKPGPHQTPSFLKLYGPLIRAGKVRLIQKKGKPPAIQWL